MLTILIVSICSFIQGALSFGGGLFMIPLLSFNFDLKLFVIPFLSIFNIFSNSLNVISYGKEIKIRDYKHLFIAGLVGVIIGANIILIFLDKQFLEWIIAIALIINALNYFIFKKGIEIKSKTGEILLGFISGIFGGSVGLASFGIAIFYQKIAQEKIKALVAKFCLMGNLLTLASFIMQGRYNLFILKSFLICFIPFIVSQRIGILASKKLKNDYFITIVNIFLLVFSVMIVIF